MNGKGGRVDAPPGLPEMSAVVCTRNRPEQLGRAVRSLLAQGEELRGIVVVDNAPRDDRLAEPIGETAPGVGYVREPRAGLDFARNRGLAEATAELVAFIDDDVTVEPGWARALRRAFADHPGAGLCAGRVLPFEVESEGSRLFERNGGYERGERVIVLPRRRGRPLHGLPAPAIAWAVSVGSGSSFAVDRSLALTLGGFDEALDLGPFLPGGGDHDMFYRVLRSGRLVVYEPAAAARHENRPSVEGACAQIVGHQKGLLAMLAKTLGASRPSEAPGVALFLAWRLAKPGVRLIRKLFGADPLPAGALWKMWGACWSGAAGYRGAVREAARRRGN